MSQESSVTDGRSRRPTGLGDALGAFLRESGIGAQLRHAEVFQAWADSLGPRLAPKARAVRFQFGELTVEVESAPHLHELQNFTGESFRRTANGRLGDEVIQTVLFRLKR